MKKIIFFLLIFIAGCIAGCDFDNQLSGDETIKQDRNANTDMQKGYNDEVADKKIRITVGNTELNATLYDNPTTKAFIEKLPLTLPMIDLYGREKAYRFTEALPTGNVAVSDYEIGEIIYWPPRHSFVIMYAQNGEEFSMQKMGHVHSGTEIFKEMGAVNVTFELINTSVPENSQKNNSHSLNLSDMSIKVISDDNVATFRLYETTAAKELYDQLPLELELTNFRDAQWMFYPPKELNVTEKEAYHDGKKGELSYYEPWGDVFMLYEDFFAGDKMHRLGVSTSGKNDIEDMSGKIQIERNEAEETKMKMSVESNDKTIIFELDESKAAKELYEQLPLNIEVENHGGTEKIFYPPEKLDTTNTPLADAKAGTLAYYAPWGDVVMFYGDFGSANGLYELGHVISGGEHINELSGTISVRKVDD